MHDRGLEVSGLEVSRGAARVLERVDLRVARGDVVGLAGANGAGKTTALRAISGLERRRGSVTVDGVELPTRPDAVVRRGVSHVPEGRGLMPSLTVQQNLEYGAIAAGQRYGSQAAREIEEVFPALGRLRRRRAGSLSGGEQQMVAIGRGLASNPRYLLVDELSLGLAPKIVEQLLMALVEVAQARSIGLLLVDQNVLALRQSCRRVYFLVDGCSHEATGSSEEFMGAYFGFE